MANYILAGVGNIDLYNQGDLIATSKTLTESSISVEVTGEDVRGGQSNPLLGRYFHDSSLTLTLTDALFSLEYLALNVGGTIEIGGNVLTTEEITIETANTITVTGTPVELFNWGTVGYYRIAGENEWNKITFTGKTATVSDLPIGTVVCVKYNTQNAGLRQFVIPSNMIPAECTAILTIGLFKADNETKVSDSSSRVGTLVIEIPRFQFAGSQELSLTSDGVATTNLTGSALAVYTGTSCDDDGYYAIIKEVVSGANWYDGLQALAIANGADIDLQVPNAETLQVYAVYGGIVASSIVDNSNLTFTSENDSYATVDNTGKIAAVAAGETNIKVVATGKPEIEAIAKVTVTAG